MTPRDQYEALIEETARRAARRARILSLITDNFELDGSQPGQPGGDAVQRGYVNRWIAGELRESVSKPLIAEIALAMDALGVYKVTRQNRDYFKGIKFRGEFPDWWIAQRERMQRYWAEKKKSEAPAK